MKLRKKNIADAVIIAGGVINAIVIVFILYYFVF
jgi:hypothetical protein